jgi:hypothetical protein
MSKTESRHGIIKRLRTVEKQIARLAEREPFEAFVLARQVAAFAQNVAVSLDQRLRSLNLGSAGLQESLLDWTSTEAANALLSAPVHGVASSWRVARRLTEALHAAALKTPTALVPVASRERYMPSLRSLQERDDYDFGVIAKNTGLASALGYRTEGKMNLDSPAHRYTIRLLEEVEHVRQRVDSQVQVVLLQQVTASTEQALAEIRKALRDLQADLSPSGAARLAELQANYQTCRRDAETNAECLEPEAAEWSMLAVVAEHELQNPATGAAQRLRDALHRHLALDSWEKACACLPPFSSASQTQWWKDAIKPRLERPEALPEAEAAGVKLIKESQPSKAGEVRITTAERRDELKKAVQRAVQNLAM